MENIFIIRMTLISLINVHLSHTPVLTNCGLMTHNYVSKLTIINLDNGLSSGRRQAIIWSNAGILLIRPIRINFNEIWIEIHTFHSRQFIWKCRLENGVHFVLVWRKMYQTAYCHTKNFFMTDHVLSWFEVNWPVLVSGFVVRDCQLYSLSRIATQIATSVAGLLCASTFVFRFKLGFDYT